MSGVFVSAQELNEYTFKELAFKIICPAGWEVRKIPAGDSGELVGIILPKDAGRSGFRANMVIVSSVQEDASKPLSEVYRMNIDSMKTSQDFPGFNQENSYNIKVGGMDAYQTTITYSHPKLGIKLKSFQIYTMKNDRLYVIQYAAPTLTYKKYMNDVNKIAETFRAL